MALVQTIQSIVSKLRAGQYRNESEVREALVIRVLQDLGWDIFDPESVRREFTVEKRRIDYALFASPHSPSVFVEAKAPNSSGDGDRQLFEYAFHQGAPFAILVDGREWSFFLPGEQGNYSERRVHKLDLLERDPTDAAKIFERYLQFDRVKNGAALVDARSDYQSAARARDASNAIPRAWLDLVSEPDELLVDLIAEKVVSLTGSRPTDEQIEEYLLSLNAPNKSPSREASVAIRQVVHPNIETTTTSQSERAWTSGGQRRVPVIVDGVRSEHPDAISALIFILKGLAAKQSNFFEIFAKAAPGRRRNHISKDRSNVYPDKPELEFYTIDIGNGWWLGTNIANREKERLVKIACQVAKLSFGKDVRVEFPNVGK